MAKIVTAQVFHARTRPKRNAFRYGVYYLRLTLDELAAPAKCALFSLDRFNLFSIHGGDYRTGPLAARQAVAAALEEFGVTEADGQIELITMPRVTPSTLSQKSSVICCRSL